MSCTVSTRSDGAYSKDPVSKAERRKKRWRLQKPNLRGVSKRTTKCTWRVMAGEWDEEGKLTGKRDRCGHARMDREPAEQRSSALPRLRGSPTTSSRAVAGSQCCWARAVLSSAQPS